MDVIEFAASRSKRLTEADNEIAPLIEKAGQTGKWADVVEGAAVLWLEIFEKEAPGKKSTYLLENFQRNIRNSLNRTERPVDVDRVTKWVGTYTVNSATYWGNRAMGNKTMRWVTMHDSAVRHTHREADGEVVSSTGTFDVGGYKLRFPGDPVGPPEIWINCRCLLAGGEVKAMTASASDIETLVKYGFDPEELRADPEGIANPTLDELLDHIREEQVIPDEFDIDNEPTVDDESEVPFHAVITLEGTPTGDMRMFKAGALSVRDLPLPLSYQHQSDSGHGGSVVIGRFDEVWKDDRGYLLGRGVFNSNEPVAQRVIEDIANGFTRGLSVDVDDIEIEVEELSEDASLADILNAQTMQVFSRARMAGATIVSIPAFQEAYIGLGYDFPDAEAMAACGCTSVSEEDFQELDAEREEVDSLVAAAFAPGTHDGPGWITNPRATARIRRYWVSGKGAAKIGWGRPGDFNRCRKQLAKYVQNPDWLAGLCANMHKEAIGVWPGMEAGGRKGHHASDAITAAAVNIMDTEPITESRYFQNPNLTEATGIRIDDDGRIYGYVATWNVCHIGFDKMCRMAPHSATDYAMFATGFVKTEDGMQRVGQITMGTGHASLNADLRNAAAHYDNTGAAVADVTVGEDGIGIWFSGKLRDNVTAQQIHDLRASGRLSGDWRGWGSGLEMVAALAVNVPGFPVPPEALAASGGYQSALVAAGIVDATPIVASAQELDADAIIAITKNAVADYRHQEKVAAATAPLRDKFRQRTLAAARGRFKEEK